MRRFNVLTGELPVKQERSGYGWRGRRGVAARARPAAGLAPASMSCPTASGRSPTTTTTGLRSGCTWSRARRRCAMPTGERVLAPGDLVCFPSGPDGAHAVRGPGRVVMFSGVAAAEAASVSVYPDSDKLGVRPPGGGPDRLDFRRARCGRLLGRRMSAKPRPVVNARTIEVAARDGSSARVPDSLPTARTAARRRAARRDRIRARPR